MKGRRHSLAYAATVCAALLLSGAAVAAPPPPPEFATLAPGDKAPALEGTTLEGARWTLSGLNGRRVVIDFGSVFCIPCRQTLALMGAVVEPFRRRGIEVLYVNLDGLTRKKTVQEFLKKEAPALTTIMDPGEIALRFGAREIPYLVVIGPEGTVLATHLGKPADSAELLRLIEGE